MQKLPRFMMQEKRFQHTDLAAGILILWIIIFHAINGCKVFGTTDARVALPYLTFSMPWFFYKSGQFYKADGSVDLATAEKYVEWYAEKGCDGIFAVCQSSEIFYLSLEERVALNAMVYSRAKELEKARKNLSSLEGKLNNENFVSRAPANVVDDIRQKAQKARDLIAGLEQSEEAMKKI